MGYDPPPPPPPAYKVVDRRQHATAARPRIPWEGPCTWCGAPMPGGGGQALLLEPGRCEGCGNQLKEKS